MILPPIQKSPVTGQTAFPDALSLQERLHLIGLMGQGMEHTLSDNLAGLFNDLSDQIHTTVSASRLLRLNPQNSQNGFHRLEINAESGETLGWMNMLYLKKPIPSYYLVYVEVAPFFRKKGLGDRIIAHFKQFLIEKSAVGILDNIIPKEDPTYHIYRDQGWQPAEYFVGKPLSNGSEHYMIYVPPNLHRPALKTALQKALFHLSRKREIVDMRDNEIMVKQTLHEFKSLYDILLTRSGIEAGLENIGPAFRFFFTRFVIKLIAFRRLIGDLIGYTGGESIEQIALSPKVAALPIQSYVPAEWVQAVSSVSGDFELLAKLPGALLRQPAVFIESLPNYQRPSLVAWLEKKGAGPSHVFTIADLMELGFDPTRLKEITLENRKYVFERVQRKRWMEIQKKQKLLDRIQPLMASQNIRGTRLAINPPLLWISDQGHTYILRNKIAGIHWEEALEQTQTQDALKQLNRMISLDKLITHTVQTAMQNLTADLTLDEQKELQHLAWFVSWNPDNNQPGLVLDDAAPYFESVYAA